MIQCDAWDTTNKSMIANAVPRAVRSLVLLGILVVLCCISGCDGKPAATNVSTPRTDVPAVDSDTPPNDSDIELQNRLDEQQAQESSEAKSSLDTSPSPVDEASQQSSVVPETQATDSTNDQSSDDSTQKVDTDLAADPNPIPELDPKPIRLLLPTQQGPLLVDVDIRIDDVPLTKAFEQRIKQVMSAADSDESSDLSWDELLDHLAASPEIFGNNVASGMDQRRNVIRLQDRNRNGRADYDEVRRMLFRDSGFDGPFRLRGTDYYRGRQNESRLFATLDQDESGKLESNEIDAATVSLLRADKNTDQRLDIAEVMIASSMGGEMMTNNSDPAWNRRRSNRYGSVATDLLGYVDWSMASYALDDLRGKRPFSLTTDPIAQLDQDSDDAISITEAKRLLEAQPDLILRAELFSDTSGDTNLQILWIRSELQPLVQPVESLQQIAIADEQMGLCAQLVDNRSGPNQLTPEVFAMLDANDDGKLDKAEIPDQLENQYSFDDFDTDNDDKLTLAEIHEGMRPKAPIWSVQLRGRAAEFPDAFFALLDQDNNFSLSTREITAAPERLRSLATEGELDPTDVAGVFLIQIVRGDPRQRDRLFTITAPPKARSPSESADAKTPRWARQMDANGDNEISRLEFPGTVEQFDQLDRDQDGYIEWSETLERPPS
ncbi:MAG: hypothetical protein HKN47_09155 [Pirellulaceae bacterium]|nr:hypothetical protein [Pirellulaceae bacterium]